MTAIWQNDGTGWHLLVPTSFPNEATLHDLVEQAPHLLPLAGNPSLVVLGREVQLGNGYADLIAIEPSCRLAVIEINLKQCRSSPGSHRTGAGIYRLPVGDESTSAGRGHLGEAFERSGI